MRNASLLSAFVAFLILLSFQDVLASTNLNVSGTVTTVLSAGEFVFQTGFPHGHVLVFYTEAMVVPGGSQIAVGQSVTVTGTFNRFGQLNATTVTLGSSGSSGPYHIDTWAYDNYQSQGSGASAASVNQLVSYAQGNGKAPADCHTGTHSCKAVFYVNPNHEYGAPCTYHPDADVVAAASESWFIHNSGFSDAAHRVYGRSSGGCAVWEMNPNSSGVQAWWLAYLRSHADNYDLYFLDNDPMDVTDEGFFSGSGGGCMPWPTYCITTQEISNNVAQVQAHANFVDAMSHSNGSPMQFLYQQASFNIPLDVSAFTTTNRLVGFSCEGCIATTAIPVRPTLYASVLKEMAAVNASPGFYLLMSHGEAPAGSATQVLQRMVTTGIAWLAYSEGHTVVQPDLEANTNNLAVWPEDLIYPANPIQSMISGPNDLQVASGVWRREFSSCYQAGRFFGRCAVVVNSTSGTLRIPASWFTQSYHHVISVAGGDVLAGGVATVANTAFVANSTSLSPGGALLLAQ